MTDKETCSAAGYECPHCGHLHRHYTERAISDETATCKGCGKSFHWWTKVMVHFYADVEPEP